MGATDPRWQETCPVQYIPRYFLLAIVNRDIYQFRICREFDSGRYLLLYQVCASARSVGIYDLRNSNWKFALIIVSDSDCPQMLFVVEL